jgi:hypothetical protein
MPTVTVTRANGATVLEMAAALITSRMEIPIMEAGIRIKSKGLVESNTQMEIAITGTGFAVQNMGMDFSSIRMMIAMKGNGGVVNAMVVELIFGKLGRSILETGRMILWKVKVSSFMLERNSMPCSEKGKLSLAMDSRMGFNSLSKFFILLNLFLNYFLILQN